MGSNSKIPACLEVEVHKKACAAGSVVLLKARHTVWLSSCSQAEHTAQRKSPQIQAGLGSSSWEWENENSAASALPGSASFLGSGKPAEIEENRKSLWSGPTVGPCGKEHLWGRHLVLLGWWKHGSVQSLIWQATVSARTQGGWLAGCWEVVVAHGKLLTGFELCSGLLQKGQRAAFWCTRD